MTVSYVDGAGFTQFRPFKFWTALSNTPRPLFSLNRHVVNKNAIKTYKVEVAKLFLFLTLTVDAMFIPEVKYSFYFQQSL